MKTILRWILIIFGAVIVGFIFVLITLSIKSGHISPQFQLGLGAVSWIGVWIGSGIYLKKAGKVQQPFAYGFMIGLFALIMVLWSMQEIFPSKEELLKKAQASEQEYFLLSAGSLDHARICNAAKQAYKYYDKAEVEDKTKLFEYIIFTDKCL